MAYLGSEGNLSDVTDEEVDRTKRGASRMLEPGWYRCALVEDEVDSKGWGIGLRMQFQIIDGDYSPQRIFDYLCVRHSRSEKAEQIARAKLKAFAIAAGSKNPDDVTDTDPLHNKPVMIQVYRAKDDTKYAEEDGCKPRIGSIVSVSEWKESHADEPRPGVSGGKPKQAAKAPKPAVLDDTQEPDFDEEPPF